MAFKTPARITAVGMLTGAIAFTALVVPGPAHAWDPAVWDRVAQCESGGNWALVTGNGFEGGLQFRPSTWEAFGGTQYATNANLAPKDQQIAIARRVLYTQGPEAWPNCSVTAGLTKDNGGADPDALPETIVNGFADISPTTQFFNEMVWMRDEGISTGWPDGTYRPWEPVYRDAMAAFMYRLADSPEFDAPAVSPFTDVTPQTPFYKEMAWMKAADVSTGWSDGTYKPWEPVYRDAMAAFMYRLAGSPEFDAPAVSPFTDVTPTTPFYKEMAWAKATGISTGWPDGTYKPWDPVNRDAMAAFMARLDSYIYD